VSAGQDDLDARGGLETASRLSALGRFDEALRVLKAMWARVPATPAIAFALGIALLRFGVFEEGLVLYEQRLQETELAPQRRLAPEKRWRGKNRDGDTILVVAEQGMGDMIQFARYVAPLAARGLRVILHTPPALFRLFRTLPGVHAMALTSAPLPAFDWQCPIVSIPLALGTRLESIPADVAATVTKAVKVPTIGIGAGPDCDGQVLVSYDMLGLFDGFVPSFVKQYAKLADEVVGATRSYVDEVKQQQFPSRAESVADVDRSRR